MTLPSFQSRLIHKLFALRWLANVVEDYKLFKGESNFDRTEACNESKVSSNVMRSFCC